MQSVFLFYSLHGQDTFHNAYLGGVLVKHDDYLRHVVKLGHFTNILHSTRPLLIQTTLKLCKKKLFIHLLSFIHYTFILVQYDDYRRHVFDLES